jgi:DNA-directed RNA polymerase specialized sigma24 family protein
VPDTESFDAFYRASRQRVHNFALTGDAAEAQDVAHARAWPRWGTVGEYGSPEAWLRTVAHRIAVSRWRQARSAAGRRALARLLAVDLAEEESHA